MSGSRPARRPVVIDCDPGTDDALALLLALASPELDVRAVTVAGGNVGLQHTLPNARALVALTGGTVPVYGGADRPLLGAFEAAAHIHGDNGLGGLVLPDGPPATPGIAADTIRTVLRQSASPVTLVGIGPATNLALALATDPALAANVAEIVLMTGAWGDGNMTAAAEFNALSDPEALAVVIAAARPLTLATLDLTRQARVTTARVAALAARGPGRALAVACDILSRVPSWESGLGFPLHDPCTIAWLVRPSLFTAAPRPVTVDLTHGPNRGRTVIDRRSRTPAAPNATILETIDADGFFDLLSERLAVLP